MKMPKKKPAVVMVPPLLFISYSHVDEECRKRLRIHLKPLVRGGKLRVFDDTELHREIGWRKQLIQKLNEADLVLMLVSADFLASDFCFVEEWPVARKRWKSKEAIVTFALIGPCQWKITDIAPLQGVPKHGEMLPDEKSKAAWFWDGVTDKVREDAKKMHGRKPAKAKPAAPAKRKPSPRGKRSLSKAPRKKP